MMQRQLYKENAINLPRELGVVSSDPYNNNRVCFVYTQDPNTVAKVESTSPCETCRITLKFQQNRSTVLPYPS